MGDFELDTRLEGGDGRYRANVSPDWEIWGPNGGYVAAMALRAAGREAAIARPVSFSCHFLTTADFAPVELSVSPLRRGRRAESLQVTMEQGEKLILHGILRTAAEGPGLEHDFARMPAVPDPDTLKSWEEMKPDEPPFYPFWMNLEGKVTYPERIDAPPQSYEPVFREWYRFRPRATFDDVWVDAGRLLLLIDTLSWPAACLPHPWPRAYMAPNMDVTAWFHRFAPESDWLLVDTESAVAEGGLMGTTSRVWSRDGRLLASGGAQLLCVPAPGE